MANYTNLSNSPGYSDAPEVVPGVGKITVPDDNPPEVTNNTQTYYDSGAYGGYVQTVTALAPRFWQRKRVWAIAPAVLLALIGLAVGLGVGLSRGAKTEDSDELNTANESREGITFCDDDNFCRKSLHASEFNDTLYLFGRSTDNRIVVKKYKESQWDEDWEELGPKDDMMISPPSALRWDKEQGTDPELGLFSVSENRSLYRRGLWGEDWSPWMSLNPNVGSQLVLCTINNRIHIWGVDEKSRKIAHNFWVREGTLKDSDWDSASNNGKWAEDDFKAEAVSGLGAVCRENASTVHDVAWYEEESDGKVVAKHQKWTDEKWQDDARVHTGEGNFVGDPLLYYHAANDANVYFLGVQNDSMVYHYNWTDDNGYSELESLGGSIAGSPTAVSIDSGETTDLFALSTNKTLQHQFYNGSHWASDWDDVGVQGKGAPTVQLFDDQVFVFLINENGTALAVTFNIRRGQIDLDPWKQTDLGGELSNKGYY